MSAPSEPMPSASPPSWTAGHGPVGPQARPPGGGRRAALVVALVVLVVALAAAGTVAVVQSVRLADTRRAATELVATVEEREQRIRELESALESRPGSQPANPQGALEDLLGDDVTGLLEELEALLGEEGPFAGGGEVPDLGGIGDVLGGLGGSGSTLGCLGVSEDLPDIGGATVEAQVASAVGAVEEVRGLSFPEPLEPTILSGEEIRERLDAEVRAAYSAEEAEVDRVLLAALGAVPADIDLVATQSELLGDQVAGFYDTTTRELVVRSDDPDEPLDVLGLVTMVHELGHALVDATIGLPDLEDEPAEEDATLAELAIIEGDAVALQTVVSAVALSPVDLLAALSDPEALASAQAGLEDVPPFIAASLTFPYVAGPPLVCDTLAEGGWPAVDALLRDPPTTTAEILYGEPLVAVAPAPIGGPQGWAKVADRSFGAAPLTWLFSAPGMDRMASLDDPVEAARGWRGGRVQVWHDGGDGHAVTLGLVDGGGLCESVTTWWERTEAAVTPLAGTVVCAGDQVMVGVADTEDLALAALGQ